MQTLAKAMKVSMVNRIGWEARGRMTRVPIVVLAVGEFLVKINGPRNPCDFVDSKSREFGGCACEEGPGAPFSFLAKVAL